VTQAIFPYVNSKFNESYEEGKEELLKISKIVLIITGLICLGIIVFNKLIVLILLGKEYLDYSQVLQIMAIWIFLSILNNLLGVQYLIGTGHGGYYSKAFSIAAVVTLIIMLVLINFISIYAVVIATILGEFTLTVSMVYIIKRKISKN
jgi:PST family polysaccharide transporter